MFGLCRYKNALGRPGKGIHSYRIANIAVVDVTFEGNKNAEAISQALKLILPLRNGPKPIAVTVKIHDDLTLELLVK